MRSLLLLSGKSMVTGHWYRTCSTKFRPISDSKQLSPRISGASQRQVQARKRRGSSKFSDWVALTTYYTIANQVTWKWKWNQENCNRTVEFRRIGGFLLASKDIYASTLGGCRQCHHCQSFGGTCSSFWRGQSKLRVWGLCNGWLDQIKQEM